LTRLSGHGRLRKSNGEFIDIGGSTGGFVRTVLDDWEPPDFNDFND
jgi:predicted rRNA methylase YqxC with S4 and FtsJ domains